MTLSGVGFSGSGCDDLTWTKLNAERIRQSETCAVPDFANGDSRGFAVQRPWGTSGQAAVQSERENSCLDEGTRWLRTGAMLASTVVPPSYHETGLVWTRVGKREGGHAPLDLPGGAGINERGVS